MCYSFFFLQKNHHICQNALPLPLPITDCHSACYRRDYTSPNFSAGRSMFENLIRSAQPVMTVNITQLPWHHSSFWGNENTCQHCWHTWFLCVCREGCQQERWWRINCCFLKALGRAVCGVHMNHRRALDCAISKRGRGNLMNFWGDWSFSVNFFWVISLLCLLQQEDLFIFLTNVWGKYIVLYWKREKWCLFLEKEGQNGHLNGLFFKWLQYSPSVFPPPSPLSLSKLTF